jgi:hypothetical protein
MPLGLPAMEDPHLLQNFVPSLIVAPQELQNAIEHLGDRFSLNA